MFQNFLILVFIGLWASFLQADQVIESRAEPKAKSQKILVSVYPYALLLNSFKHEADISEVLVAPGSSGHDFQLRPSHLKKINQADIIIWGGESLEPGLAKAFVGHKQQIQLDQVKALQVLQGSGYEYDIDPHIWFSQQNAVLIARVIANALGYSEATLNAFEAKLASINAAQQVPEQVASTKSLWVYHDAFSYLEKDMGIKHSLVIKQNHNTQLGLKHWQEIRKQLEEANKNKQGICLLTVPGFDESSEAKKLYEEVKRLDMQNQFTSIEIDPLASSKAYQHYLDFLQDTRAQILSCLY